MISNHEIDYKLYGEEMQYVEIELDNGETVLAESGSFMMMQEGIKMSTIFGDGSTQGGGIMGKIFTAGKRLLTGESLFMTGFTNENSYKSKVSFAAPYPGKIIPLDLSTLGGKIICQKDSFLCAAKGVQIGIEFQRKLGTGLFGGEGFIMQKLEGDGMAFMHAGGHVLERELEVGEKLLIDTGCIVGFNTISNSSKALEMCYLGVRVYFMPHCEVLEKFGYRLCLYPDWQVELSPMVVLREEKKKAVSLVL